MHRTNIAKHTAATSSTFIATLLRCKPTEVCQPIQARSRGTHRAPLFLTSLVATSVILNLPILVTRAAADAAQVGQAPAVSTTNANAPAAAPKENPPALSTPVGPDKGGAAPNQPPANAPAAAPPPATITPSPAGPISPPTPTSADLEGRQIASVHVVGNRVLQPDIILLQTASKVGGAYSSAQAERDRAAIEKLGFFASAQVQVTPDLEDAEKVDVVYVVVENRVVTGFKFIGNNVITVPDLERALASKVGSVLNRGTVDSDVNKIQELYRQRGYAALVLNAQESEAGVIVYTIQEARISRIDISGLRRTKPSLVRLQIRVKPGDSFDQKKIRLDLNRIYDMGFFDDVTFKVDDDPDVPGAVIVTIGLKEKRTGTFSVGLGFDSQSKLSGFVTLGESNVRGEGTHTSISVQTGAQHTLDLDYGNPFIGKRQASYDIDIFTHRFFLQPQTVQEIAGVPTNTTDEYEEERTGVRLNYTIPLDIDKTTSILLGYRNEKAELFVTSDLQNFSSISLPANSQGRVSAPSIGILRDKRDLRLDPSSGDREQFVVEKAVGLLGGTARFTKFDVDLRKYYPLILAKKADDLPKVVLAGRAVIGHSFGQLPAFEQYFIGGSDTVRGYDTEQQFGDNQIYTNLEIRYRIQKKFQLVPFLDNGSSYGGQFSSNKSYTNLDGVGIGIRVQTPIGPIRLDVGKGNGGFKTDFGIGPTF